VRVQENKEEKISQYLVYPLKIIYSCLLVLSSQKLIFNHWSLSIHFECLLWVWGFFFCCLCFVSAGEIYITVSVRLGYKNDLCILLLTTFVCVLERKFSVTLL